MKRPFLTLFLFLASFSPPLEPLGTALAGQARPRLFILLVWDGLRPDSVTQRETPHLFDFAREGVRFDRHHAQYPTVTLVNAATLATGAPPGTTGILGDTLFLGPALAAHGANLAVGELKPFTEGPLMMEDSARLAAANSTAGFGGYLLGLDTIAQEVEREGGFIAVIGKTGPTFLFDDRVNTVKDGHDQLHQAHENYMFLADDLAAPSADLDQAAKALAARDPNGVADRARDQAFTRFTADRAIPAAKRAIDDGHPALIVLWQHNPDLTQHLAGLGTLQASEALSASDQNLATLQAALSASGLTDRADMMVVSDHGFATIRERVWLAGLLVGAGLKKALESTDVVVAANGGTDLVYLSHDAFPTREALRERLQKIVDFCAAQEWCGAMFSRETAVMTAPAKARGRRAPAIPPYLGWINGTFSQAALGLFNSAMSPDLIISFAENPDTDNRAFTGPDHPSFVLGLEGQRSIPNKSQPLLKPMKGVLYADLGPLNSWTTGMGMHGAAGSREIHNFAAVSGSSFKRAFVDTNPTANVDVAPTIARILGLQPNVGPGSISPSGRVLTEALKGESSYVGSARPLTMTATLELQGVATTTTLKLTRLGDHFYLDDSATGRNPLGSSP